jgi:hypothetical protein
LFYVFQAATLIDIIGADLNEVAWELIAFNHITFYERTKLKMSAQMNSKEFNENIHALDLSEAHERAILGNTLIKIVQKFYSYDEYIKIINHGLKLYVKLLIYGNICAFFIVAYFVLPSAPLIGLALEVLFILQLVTPFLIGAIFQYQKKRLMRKFLFFPRHQLKVLTHDELLKLQTMCCDSNDFKVL